MAYKPYSPQNSAIYTLESAFGKAVLNDPTSPDYCGMVKEITGLDSAEVRESADEKVGADGGWHGDFFQSRRPITMTVVVFGASDMTERETRIDRLRRATKVFRAGHGVQTSGATLSGGTDHGELRWTNLPEADNVPMVVYYKRNQPFRVAGPWVKEVQLAIVSPFNEIFSQAVHSSGSPTENQGDEDAYPILTVTNAPASLTVTNSTTGKKVVMTGVTAGSTVVIDVRNHTATMNGADATGKINFVTSTWPTVKMGSNNWTTTGGSLNVKWRDAWA